MRFKIDRARTPHRDRHLEPPVASAKRAGDDWVVELGSLDDLMALMNESGFDLIVRPDRITLYDDYIE